MSCLSLENLLTFEESLGNLFFCCDQDLNIVEKSINITPFIDELLLQIKNRQEELQRSIEENNPYFNFEISITLEDKSIQFYSVYLTPAFNQSHQKRGIIGKLVSMNHTKNLETLFTQKVEEFNRIAENLHGVIFSFDKRGLFTFSQGKSLKTLGLKPGQVVGLSVFDIYKDSPIVCEGAKKALNGHVWSSICPIGDLFFDAMMTPLYNKDSLLIGVAGLAIDITEKLKNESIFEKGKRQLFHSERMALIGTLSSGIAHEINNPLSIIKGVSQLLIEGLEEKKEFIPDDRAHCFENLQKIIESADRIAKITKGLKSFNTNRDSIPLVLRPTDIQECIENTLGICESFYRKKNIVIERNYLATNPLAKANNSEIQQVLLHILTNAKDAILDSKKNGIITIETSSDKKNCSIKISDNGIGMDEEQVKKIFDPFYTTKSPGEGVGLGLTISHNIVTSLKGDFKVESKKGIGSTFILEFPLYL